jgi:hypothetical protein
MEKENYPRLEKLPFYPFMVLHYDGEKNIMEILEEVLESIGDIVCQVSLFGFHVYIQQDNGFISILSYKVYRYVETDYVITTDKVRTYDDGGELSVSLFHKFCDSIGLRNDVIIKQGRHEPTYRPFGSLMAMSSSDRYCYSVEEEEEEEEEKRKNWLSCLKKNIQSLYWEHQRYGLTSLPLMNFADTESIMIVLEYLEKENQDSEMVLLAVVCLKKLLLLRHYADLSDKIHTKISERLDTILEKTKIPSYPFFFHHGLMAREDAEEIAGSGHPGDFLIYTDVDDSLDKIMVYHSWLLGIKTFAVYRISINEDGTISYDGETYPDIWNVLSMLSLVCYQPKNAQSPVNLLIHKEIGEILRNVIKNK